MAILVHDCPRCGAREMTFDVPAAWPVDGRYGWQIVYEAFAICRACHRTTVFILAQREFYERGHPDHQRSPADFGDRALNDFFKIEGYINIKDMATAKPPEHCPEAVVRAFREGATCMAVECFNAAGTMFRLCIDLATEPMLPRADDPERPAHRICRDLGLRLGWLFDNGKLPGELRPLAQCIREDGNDGAHRGTLEEPEAEDLKDFAVALLERIFTEPERLRLAEERRTRRRGGAAPAGGAEPAG